MGLGLVRTALLLWSLASGWSPGPATAEPLRLQAVGGSILAWHRQTGQDIPTLVARGLGAEIANNAVPGARLTDPVGARGRPRLPIRHQVQPDDWDIILMTGGANDMVAACGCRACDGVLDGLITERLRGEVPQLIAQIRRGGAHVIWLGHFETVRGQRRDSPSCDPILSRFDARMARFAARRPGVTFVDAGDVMSVRDRSLYALDGIHPSREGARRIARHLLRAIEQEGIGAR